jgi:hypothetical protein
MSTYCQELKHKITYGDPFFILIPEGKPGGAIVSIEAMNRVSESDRLIEPGIGTVAVYAADSTYSMGDTYSWFHITKQAYLFSLSEHTFDTLFRNSKALFES